LVDLPFADEYTLGGIEREFFIDRDDEEYVWHRDNEHREIEILEGDGWCFQFENCLPYLLQPGMIFDVPRGEYHRVLKGVNTLKCRIISKDG
tara:strand:- start:1488 stop:1763 length:276 start_codon:yes stop_codon:yes gene_type:complete